MFSVNPSRSYLSYEGDGVNDSSRVASCCTTNQSPIQLHQSHVTKVLTNFSIDSIIGQQEGGGGEFQHEAPRVPKLEKSNSTLMGVRSRRNTNDCPKKYRPKNFQCPVCQMAFSNNGQLKNHVRIHTGERPFRCNLEGCSKTFTRNEELTRHKLIHTGVRPHACPSCCKRFGRKDHLKKHVRTHERKRQRKRVYVPSNAARPDKEKRSAIMSMSINGRNVSAKDNNSLFSPSKLPVRRGGHTRGGAITTQAPRPTILPAPINSLPPPPTTLPFNQYGHTLLPPVTLAQHYLGESSIKTMASLALPTSMPPACQASTMMSSTTGAALQQLAGDYWHKWYSFLGFCQQQTIATSTKRL